MSVGQIRMLDWVGFHPLVNKFYNIHSRRPVNWSAKKEAARANNPNDMPLGQRAVLVVTGEGSTNPNHADYVGKPFVPERVTPSDSFNKLLSVHA